MTSSTVLLESITAALDYARDNPGAALVLAFLIVLLAILVTLAFAWFVNQIGNGR